MGVEQAVLTHLKATAGVIALAATRGYLQKFPQDPTTPAFRVQLINESESGHLRGGSTTKPARVQVDAIASEGSGFDPYAAASNLADAISAALMSQAPIIANGLELKVTERPTRFAGYDPDERRIVRIVQDFLIWSKPMT